MVAFPKVDEHGGTSYPTPDGEWSLEISLDLAMVSAMCPNCHILLVEATSDQFSDLGVAVDEAVSLGATVVSNSYGSSEFNSRQAMTRTTSIPVLPSLSHRVTAATERSGRRPRPT